MCEKKKKKKEEERIEERERDGGHRVDKAVLFLIYVLL